jgi:hypothetical protein
MAASTKRPKANLSFKYCECGCHGHAAGTGDLSYWIYDDLKGRFWAVRGHGFTFGKPLGKFDSHRQARNACNKDATRRIEQLLEQCGVDAVRERRGMKA